MNKKNIHLILILFAGLMVSANVSGLEIGETDIDTEATETEDGVMIDSEASYTAATGGYTMEGSIERISEDEVEITFEVEAPGDEEIVTQAITEVEASVEQEFEDLEDTFTVTENITLENETLMEEQYETTAGELEFETQESEEGVWDRLKSMFTGLL